MDEYLAILERQEFVDPDNNHLRFRRVLTQARCGKIRKRSPESLVNDFLHHDTYKRNDAALELIAIAPLSINAIGQALHHKAYVVKAWAAFVIREAGLDSPLIRSSLETLLDDEMVAEDAERALQRLKAH
jgi:hypothetical protein